MRVIIFLLVVGCCVACSSNSVEQKNVATTKALFEAFNKHDWQAMAALYAEPAQMLDPVYGTDFVSKSHADIIENYAQLHALFPDIRDSVTNIYPSGDHVIVTFISTGTAQTEDAEFVELVLPIATVLTFKDGLIVRDATYYNQ